MARNSLQEFREQLTLAYLSDVIDMEEYVYLYSTNQSREVFPYWKFNKFDFENWDDTECYKELRFRKDHIANLLICLGIPEKVFALSELHVVAWKDYVYFSKDWPTPVAILTWSADLVVTPLKFV